VTFEQHIADGPQWIQWWLTWLMIINLAALLFLMRWQDGRIRLGHIEAFAIIAAIFSAFLLMMWLFENYGYVRLLGLGHIPFWTPLAIYLWIRLPHHPASSIFGVYLRLFLVTILISLAFDYTDVARYLAGDTAPM